MRSADLYAQLAMRGKVITDECVGRLREEAHAKAKIELERLDKARAEKYNLELRATLPKSSEKTIQYVVLSESVSRYLSLFTIN